EGPVDVPRTPPTQKELSQREPSGRKQDVSSPVASRSQVALAPTAEEGEQGGEDQEVFADEQDDERDSSDDASPPPPPTRRGSTPEPTGAGRPVELQSLRKGLAKFGQIDGSFGR